MNQVSYNCIICSNEFNIVESHVNASTINTEDFKVCESCLNKCDPYSDYKEVRDIIDSYVKFAETKSLFNESSVILLKIVNK